MPSTQTNPPGNEASPTELLIALDRSRPRELRAQLERDLRDAIQQGRLAVGTALPPSRTLARELALARSVVVQAYGQLAAEGYLETRQRIGHARARQQRCRAAAPHSLASGRSGASARFQAERCPTGEAFDGSREPTRRRGDLAEQRRPARPGPVSPPPDFYAHYRAVLGRATGRLMFRYPQPQGHLELRRSAGRLPGPRPRSGAHDGRPAPDLRRLRSGAHAPVRRCCAAAASRVSRSRTPASPFTAG